LGVALFSQRREQLDSLGVMTCRVRLHAIAEGIRGGRKCKRQQTSQEEKL
jgi:hypothetical protein